MTPCVLCNSTATQIYFINTHHHFLECEVCTSIFRHPNTLVSPDAEKARYLTHKNDVENLGYQSFVMPIVAGVLQEFSTAATGLDFGAGTGPVITKLLNDKGYELALYDPYFHPNTTVLNVKYDYIVCCEVIEHFNHPLKEFQRLKELLKPNGVLFCMTDLWDDSVEKFEKWYYKNDETHVLFYNKKSLQWIKNTVGFKEIKINNRLITIR